MLFFSLLTALSSQINYNISEQHEKPFYLLPASRFFRDSARAQQK